MKTTRSVHFSKQPRNSQYSMKLLRKVLCSKSNESMSSEKDGTSSTLTDAPKTTSCTKEISCVVGYMKAINRHADSDELLSFYANDKVKIKFEEGLEITAKSSCQFYQSMFKSFPDVEWKHNKIRGTKEGDVIVEKVRASGTHTGAPFKFVKPVDSSKSALFLFRDYPPLQPSGKRFENDPANFIFRVDKEKIVEVEVIAMGLKTGPLGIYEDLYNASE